MVHNQGQNTYADFPRFVVEYKAATNPFDHAAWTKLADEAEAQLKKSFDYIHGIAQWANIAVLYGATCIGQQIKFWQKGAGPGQATVVLNLPGVQLPDDYLSLRVDDGSIDAALRHILLQAFT
jgi:hypothetical protein